MTFAAHPNISPKLAHTYRLAFTIPDLTKTSEFVDGDTRIKVNTPFLSTCAHAGIIPFWEEICPTQYEDEWGTEWNTIRRRMARLSKITDPNKISLYDWVDGGLERVLKWAREEQVACCFDDTIVAKIGRMGLGIRDVYTLSSEYEQYFDPATGKCISFVSSKYWDSSLREILISILGPGAMNKVGVPFMAATIWWHAMISRILRQYKRDRDVTNTNLVFALRAAREAVGVDLPSTMLSQGMSVRMATAACVKLGFVKSFLSWQSRSLGDIEIQEKPLPPSSSLHFCQIFGRRWNQLTTTAQALNYSSLAVGYLVAIVELRTGRKFDVDLGDSHDNSLVEIGKRLVRDIPLPLIQRIPEPSEEGVDAFGAELADLMLAWHEPTDVGVFKYAATTLENIHTAAKWEEWVGASTDIGVEKYRHTTIRELHRYLGYTNKLPPFFRPYTSADGSSPPHNGVLLFPGSVATKIEWHQLVFVAAFLDKMNNPALSERPDLVTSDPSKYWIHEKWGAVPGVGLFDHMGLGKTMSAMTMIATLQNCFILQQDSPDCLPECMRDKKFGPRSTVPNDPHLIIVPKGLLTTWLFALRRFFQSGQVEIFVFGSEERQWPADMERIRRAEVAPWRRIILVTHCTLLHSFSTNRGAIEQTTVNGYPRLKSCQPSHTLYSLRYCTAFVDEAHESRTEAILWEAICAIFELALYKCAMTATPLIEQAKDLVALAKLLRPPLMSWAVQAELDALCTDLRSAKSKKWQRAQQDALDLAHATTLEAPRSGAIPGLLTTIIIRMVQKYVIPLTIRRGNESVDWEGNSITADLPTYTEVLVSIGVTDDQAQMLMGSGSETERLFTTKITGPFFNNARQYFSFPDADKVDLARYDLEQFNASGAFKAKCLVAICQSLYTNGTKEFLEEQYWGKTDTILTPEELDLGDMIHDFTARPLKPSERRHVLKIVVCTYYTKFHGILKKILNLCGFNVVVISGSYTTAQRDAKIESFKNDPSVDILLMSPVGQTGLNLTEACVIILYDVLWSTIAAAQAKARLARRGQTSPVLALQLMCKNTVEAHVMVKGVGKGSQLHTFLNVVDVHRILDATAPEDDLNDDDVYEDEDPVSDLPAEFMAVLKNPKSKYGRAIVRRARDDDDETDDDKAGDAIKGPPRKKRKHRDEDDNDTPGTHEAGPSARALKATGRRSKVKRIGSLADGPDDQSVSHNTPLPWWPDFRRTLSTYYPSLIDRYDEHAPQQSTPSESQPDFLSLAAELFPEVFSVAHQMSNNAEDAAISPPINSDAVDHLVDRYSYLSTEPSAHNDQGDQTTKEPSPDFLDHAQSPHEENRRDDDDDMGSPHSRRSLSEFAEHIEEMLRSPHEQVSNQLAPQTLLDASSLPPSMFAISTPGAFPAGRSTSSQVAPVSVQSILAQYDQQHNPPALPPVTALDIEFMMLPEPDEEDINDSALFGEYTNDDSTHDPSRSDPMGNWPIIAGDDSFPANTTTWNMPAAGDSTASHSTVPPGTSIAAGNDYRVPRSSPHRQGDLIPDRGDSAQEDFEHPDGVALERDGVTLKSPSRIPWGQSPDSEEASFDRLLMSRSFAEQSHSSPPRPSSSRLSRNPDTSFAHRPSELQDASLHSYRPSHRPTTTISSIRRRSPGPRIAPQPADPPMMLPSVNNPRNRHRRKGK